jgi:hypothetical protein
MYEWRFNNAPPDDDGFVVLDRPSGFDQVLEAENPVAAGDPDDPFALFRMGEFGDLLGRSVDDLEVGDESGIELHTETTPTVTVARGDRVLPAYVEGIWPGGPQGWLAVAVDGTLVGIGNSYQQGEFSTAWAMLPEAAFPPGEHTIDVYAVGGTPAAPVLHPVAMVPPYENTD